MPPLPFSQPPERVLIVRLSHLGDVCHALAVYHGVRRAFPQARLGWAVQPEFAGLIEGLKGLEWLVPFDRRGGWRAWPRLRGALRAHRFDLAIDAQGNWKSAMATRLSGAPLRVGMALSDWREPTAARFMTHHAAPALGEHAMDRAKALVDRLHAGLPLQYHLPLHPTERDDARAWWATIDPLEQASGGHILHLGVPQDPRSWAPERYGELAQRLAERGHFVVLLSGPGEAASGACLEKRFPARPGLVHCVGQRGLRALAARLAVGRERGMRLLVGDSGPSHVAAAVGMGVDLLAGPTFPARTGPWPLTDPTNGEGAHRVLWDGPGSRLADLSVDRVLEWLGARA